MSFEALGLTAELVRAVSEEGYSEPTPIQAKAIPEVLKGHDLMAGAQTGTGKTAGFTLPLLQRLMESNRSNKKSSQVSALVVVPTRELAAQVLESARCYGRHLPLRATAIYGGVSINPQIKELKRGVDLLVATPGRLLDHVSQRTVDLSAVEILVLDEADRMLDMGFIRDIRKIMELLPARRQNLLFSATFPLPIKKLAETILHKPVLVEVARSGTTADRVEQVVIPIEKADKRAALAYLIGSEEWQQVLVFTRTKHGANRLATQLEKDGIKTAAIHGNKSQGARTRALADFKSGAITVLVATDIAARGLDIDQLPHVVNYELPQVPEDYVHRIGRTGRAGQAGEAISLVSPDELKQFQQIERLLKQYLPRREVPGFRAPDNIVSLADHKFERQKPKPQGQGERNGSGNSQGGGRRRRSRRR